MKNKFPRFFGVLLAAVLCFFCFPVSAFAMANPEPTEEEPTTGGIEEPVVEDPLTPEGNATLVDDYGGSKQLITVTTKNGNYFYILVDRDDEGENTVHFLNQVDEADLMALLEDGDTEVAPAVCTCKEKCAAGAVNTDCPVCKINMTECAGKEAEPEEPEQPQKEKGNMGGVLLLVVLLAAGGGAFYYLKFIKPKKQNVKGISELDDLEFDDEDEDYTDDPDEEAPEDAESERDDE